MNKNSPPIIETEITETLSFIIHKIDNAIYLRRNKILDDYHTTFQQTIILMYLSLKQDKEIVNQKSVEKFMNLKGSSITSLVKQMVKKGLIHRARSKEDGRNYNLRLTEKGNDLLINCYHIVTEVNESLSKGMTADELATLKRLLLKVIGNIEE